MSNASPFVFTAPPTPTPSIDAETRNELHRRMTWGMVKAVVGSVHPASRTGERVVTYTDPKTGKPAEKKVAMSETVFRTVRAAHQYHGTPTQAVCLSCGMRDETSEGLIAAHYAAHGGPKEMDQRELRHVHALETLIEVEAYDIREGQAVTVKEFALLSDREAGSGGAAG